MDNVNSSEHRLERIFRKGDYPVRVHSVQGKMSNQMGPFGPYFHSELEFHLICRGCCKYFIKDANYPSEKNSVLIVHGNDQHCFIPDEESYTKKISLIFAPSVLQNREPSLNALTSLYSVHHLVLSDKAAATAEYLLKRISEETEQKGLNWQEIVVNYVETFLTLLQRSVDGNVYGEEHIDPVIQDVLKYLETEYAAMPSLTDVADRFGLSSYTLSKKFKQYVGVGFREYSIHLRIGAARKLLAETDMNVADVAYEVGFESLSAFNTDFRRISEVTPIVYRKMVHTNIRPNVG